MRFTLEYWLALSVLLNVVLIALIAGHLWGKRIVKPLEELNLDLKIATAELERKADEILAEYGESK